MPNGASDFGVTALSVFAENSDAASIRCQSQSASPQSGSSLLVTDDRDDLFRITEPEINAILVRRELDIELRRACERLVAEQVVDYRCEIKPGVDLRGWLTGLPAPVEEGLFELLPMLVDTFLAVADRKLAFARLESVHDNACRKFHADHVGLRMLVTFAGPGTELVENSRVDRAALNDRALSIEDANAAAVAPADIVRARVGDIVYLKGHAYHGNSGKGAVHRSPPIEGQNTSRLVLKLDEPGCGC